MNTDPAVEALTVFMRVEFEKRPERSITQRHAAIVLDALPGLLREDSPAGDAVRQRLGLTLDLPSPTTARLTSVWERTP